jgi:hypothetical protein
MRSISKPWPARLLAASMALALILALVGGSYAHAAGHVAPGAGHAAAAAVADAGHAGHHAHTSEPATPKPGQVGNAHDRDGSDHASLDCCGSMCHSGNAILAASVLVPHPALYAPLIQPAAALYGAGPTSLDRPPKPFRPAC